LPALFSFVRLHLCDLHRKPRLSKIQSILPSREGFYILPYYFRIVNEIMSFIRKKSLFLEVSKSPFVKTYKNPAPFDAG
jgi:hypothetical protein